jgi:hypothetical protein
MLLLDIISRPLSLLQTTRPWQITALAGILLGLAVTGDYLEETGGSPLTAHTLLGRPAAAVAQLPPRVLTPIPGRSGIERGDDLRSDRAPLVAEDVFARQQGLLDAALAALAPADSGRPSLYFVGYAPDGEQDVFRKEIDYAANLFRDRFGAAQRTLKLINNRETLEQVPLATVTNLDHALHAIDQKMNPERDILFLYLTSHGSRDAQLAEELDTLSLNPFTAERLAQMLKDSGIRWKVIVVSACYSGSFLDSLKDDHTLVITAARADRSSFGCSDDADFTYFGRAYLQKALNQTTSFTDAFASAKVLVDKWETRKHQQHSEPQIFEGPLIGAKLEQWRAALAPAPKGDAATEAAAQTLSPIAQQP